MYFLNIVKIVIFFFLNVLLKLENIPWEILNLDLLLYRTICREMSSILLGQLHFLIYQEGLVDSW